MIKAIIIDDEVNAISAIKIILEEYCENVKVIATAASAKGGIQEIIANSPDVVFLDIEMPHMSGFELLSYFPERKFHVVFITAYNEYAIKAFKVNAVDYILKPININELIEAVAKVALKEKDVFLQNKKLNKLIEENNDFVKKIVIPSSSGLEFFEPKEILKVVAEGSYSFLYLISNEKKIFAKNLKGIEELLKGNEFLRVHRSYIVNLNYIKRYHSKSNTAVLEMIDGSIIPVARGVKKVVAKYLPKI